MKFYDTKNSATCDAVDVLGIFCLVKETETVPEVDEVLVAYFSLNIQNYPPHLPESKVSAKQVSKAFDWMI